MTNTREHRETISCRGTSAITAVTRSLIFMLVFCFAGCAAGSCLSYGHSCWGAHGKRSGHNYPANNLQVENDDRSPSLSGGRSVNDGDSLQDQWILSRLVTRQLAAPSGDKFRGSWYDSNRGRGHGRNWDSNGVAVVSGSSKSLRRDEGDSDDDDEDELRDEGVQVVSRVMSQETQEQVLEPQEISEDDELVLVPPTENRLKPIGQAHKLRLFKILNGAAGKLI